MDRIKIKYWYLACAVLVMGILLIVVNRHSHVLTSEESNLSVALVALIIAILSIGIADVRPHRFNGRVKIHRSDAVTVRGKAIYWKVTFEIQNRSKQPLEGLVVMFRMPATILEKQGDQGFRIYRSGKSVIAVSDVMGFLGTEREDRTISLDHDLKLNDWNEGNVYVSVSAHNYVPQTFCWKHGEHLEIKDESVKDKEYTLSPAQGLPKKTIHKGY